MAAIPMVAARLELDSFIDPADENPSDMGLREPYISVRNTTGGGTMFTSRLPTSGAVELLRALGGLRRDGGDV